MESLILLVTLFLNSGGKEREELFPAWITEAEEKMMAQSESFWEPLATLFCVVVCSKCRP